MPRPAVWSLYALLVLIWSSTWVAIKFGLEDTPPLLGAGIRFALAGAVLLVVGLLQHREMRTDGRLVAILAALPFAASYGLIYWGEQHIPSGLAAVLFGVMPLYVALLVALLVKEEPIHKGLVGGLVVALAGLALGFGESLELGSDDKAGLGATAVLVSPLAAAIGNVSIKLRAARLDAVVLNGWAMLAGGALLLVVSAPTENWGSAEWTTTAAGAIGYLAIIGSAIPFVGLTILLRELPTVTVSYLPLMLPFGALLFGAALYDEKITILAAAGATLVASGILVAQRKAR